MRGEVKRWFRRTVLAFTLALAAVGAAVVYFASHEAERERMVWEREESRKIEQTAELLCERLLSSLAETLVGVSRRLTANDENSIAASVSSEDIFAEAFVIDSDGQISLPLFRQPYLLRRAAFPPVGRPSAEVAESYARAERLEFAQKDFIAAAESYRLALISSRDKSDRALVLNALARVLKKAGSAGEAERHYRRLLREFGQEPSEDGIPFGIIASLEISQLEFLGGRPDLAAKTLLDCQEKTLKGTYSLEKNAFLYYLSMLEERVGITLNRIKDEQGKELLADRRDKLLALKTEVLDRAEKAGLIREHFAFVPGLSDSKGSFERSGVHFLPKSVEEKAFLAGYVLLAEKSALGVLFDEKEIAAKRLPDLIQAVGLDEDYQVSLEISPDQTSAGPLASMSVRNHTRPFPPWILRLSAKESASSASRFGSRKTVYIMMALLLITAIFSGGVMTIRGMAKEMELVRMKTDFVATVSHELRTPLTSIRYISELLKQGRVAEEDRKGQYYETLSNESERLGRIIENILDFSKIEAGMKEYKFERTETGAFTAEVAGRFREMIASKNFTLRVEIAPDLPSVLMDAEAFGRALLNILDNAVKYSGEASEVEFSASPDGEIVQWQVTDQGLGIAPQDQFRIFDRFFRSKHGAEPNLKGSGIGLMIAKHIVEAHRGSISVESELGRGSTFIVKIPFLAEPAERLK